MPFLLLLGRHWQLITIVALIGSGFAYRAYLLNQIENKTEEVRNKEVEIVKLIAAKNMLTQTVKDRNLEVMRWKDVSTKLEQNQAQLSLKIGEIKKATTAEVAKILEEDANPANCEDAIKYMIDGKGGLKW